MEANGGWTFAVEGFCLKTYTHNFYSLVRNTAMEKTKGFILIG